MTASTSVCKIAVNGHALSSHLPRSGYVAFDAAMDGIESVTLALACEGFLVNSKRFQKAIGVAVEACETHLLDDDDTTGDQRSLIETLHVSVVNPPSMSDLSRTSVGDRRRPRYIDEFRARATQAAVFAIRHHPSWPRDPWQVSAVRVSARLWNMRCDAGRACSLMRDTLRGTVFTDAALMTGDAAVERCRDSGRKRIEMRFELLRLVSKEEAAILARASNGEHP